MCIEQKECEGFKRKTAFFLLSEKMDWLHKKSHPHGW